MTMAVDDFATGFGPVCVLMHVGDQNRSKMFQAVDFMNLLRFSTILSSSNPGLLPEPISSTPVDV